MNLKRLANWPMVLPSRGTEQAAGYDLSSAIVTIIYPGQRQVIPTGFAWQFPAGLCGQIWPRSGLAARQGIDVLAGMIDPDYRGEIGVVLINHGDDVFHIKKGDRIAQMVLVPFYAFGLSLVDDLVETDRGADGFGSTGA